MAVPSEVCSNRHLSNTGQGIFLPWERQSKRLARKEKKTSWVRLADLNKVKEKVFSTSLCMFYHTCQYSTWVAPVTQYGQLWVALCSPTLSPGKEMVEQCHLLLLQECEEAQKRGSEVHGICYNTWMPLTNQNQVEESSAKWHLGGKASTEPFYYLWRNKGFTVTSRMLAGSQCSLYLKQTYTWK